MGDETTNSMNLDLNLGPLPEPEEAISGGSMNLEEFIGAGSRLRGGLRQREIESLWRSNGGDRIRQILRPRDAQRLRQLQNRFTESLRPRVMQTLVQSDSIDHLGERLRLREIHALRRSDGVDRIREILPFRVRPRRRSIWREAPVPQPIASNIVSELVTNPISDPSSSFLSGEASVTPAERDVELLKVTENNNDTNVDSKEIGGKGNEDKGNDDDKASFFDCNICLDLAKDPVVTCCGHLFCWPCIYQWLNLHSIASECPVCKGEVTMKNVIPIYGRGNSLRGPEHDLPGLEIPVRPHARRVESMRQTILRNSVSISMDELLRRLSEGTRDHLAGSADLTVPRNSSSERMNFFTGRDREEPPPALDDGDSVSSIAAVIQSESQTMDTALEIDSNVSLSTSTSRRRNRSDASRASDVDSVDSRTHRRRLN